MTTGGIRRMNPQSPWSAAPVSRAGKPVRLVSKTMAFRTGAGLLIFLCSTLSPAFSQAPPTAAGAGRGGGGLFAKDPALPSNLFAAKGAIARSKLRHEWVDIPMGRQRLHTWIVYPAGDGKAPVVLVMHYDAGLDDLQRALADQIATEGFIAVAPDLLSGMGPKGGNYDSFPFPDNALRAVAKIPPAEAMKRYKAAYDYALQLPRSNGAAASLGQGVGGTDSFRFATETPNLSAAVVIYGTPPTESAMANIKAPVLGIYGGDDSTVVAAVEPTMRAMEKLGKSYEPHIYPGATHFFMSYVVEGQNGPAVAASWPVIMDFLKQHTNLTSPPRNEVAK